MPGLPAHVRIAPLAMITMIALASTAAAERVVVTGNVAAVEARWSSDDVVTESTVRGARGDLITVVQLGGVIDGIGMTFSHQPAIPQVGDEVELEIEDGTPVVRGVRSRASFAAATATATYGVQRTGVSKLPLWRETGCLDMVYDTATVPDDMARVIEDSFSTWTQATAQCGGLSFVSERRQVPTARDDINSVHVRSDRWCRPATATAPELCYAPEAAAVTRLVYIDNPFDDDDGKIIEADMDLNRVGFALLLPGASSPADKIGLDLQSVVTHEVGHVLGLAHNCGVSGEAWPTDVAGQAVPACDGLAAESTTLAATMYYRLAPGDSRGRTLEPSDTAGACARVSELTCERYVEGGCSAGGGPGTGTALVPLLWIMVRRRSRSRITLLGRDGGNAPTAGGRAFRCG